MGGYNRPQNSSKDEEQNKGSANNELRTVGSAKQHPT
jgi:hypothetical protein